MAWREMAQPKKTERPTRVDAKPVTVNDLLSLQRTAHSKWG
jgi:hypothetical protein